MGENAFMTAVNLSSAAKCRKPGDSPFTLLHFAKRRENEPGFDRVRLAFP
jgi:hypothetical protein